MKTRQTISHPQPLRWGLAVLAVLACTITNPSGAFAAEPLLKPAASVKDIVLNGDAKCTTCHDESDNAALLAIGKTRHGTKADGNTPSCVSCHGESDKHVNKPDGVKDRPKPDVSFKGKNKSDAAMLNGACVSCHQKDAQRSHWAGSIHESRDVTCTSCHQVHAAHDKVRDKRTQPEVCFACHKKQRAEVSRPSHHPVLEGKVACSDCHNAHGSVGVKLMKRDTVVDTCYQCHAEKRGPFVHNHEPVSEDCSNCHNPHGTVVESMLKARPPFLCHQCHTPHGGFIPQIKGAQVSPPTNANGLGKGTTNATQGRACLNCHTEIHGSNNPSATNPTPQFMLR